MSKNFASLPQELIRDIFLRLSAKSVGQSRCVSRPWRALLSKPDFIRAYLRGHNHEQEQLLLLSRSRALYILTFNAVTTENDGVLKKVNLPGREDNWINVVGSCNGLALVVDEERDKYLINPTTTEIVKLSDSPEALDPSSSFCMHGFGYDKVNDDYKIVTLSYYDIETDHDPDCADTFLDVYSVKMGSWRRLGFSPYDHAVADNDSGVFINGSLHWLATDNLDYSSVIAAFDLTTEEFEELPHPPSVNRDKFVFNKLVILGGCLCMVDDHFRDRLVVWMMKEYGVGESWTKLIINGPEYFDTKPLCPLGNENTVVVVDGVTLVVHNLRERTSRALVTDGSPVEIHDGVSFRASLISPKFNTLNEE